MPVIQKAQYLGQMQAVMTQLAELSERAGMLAQVYLDRDYEGSKADAVLIEDLESFGVVIDDLNKAVSLCQQLKLLADGQSTTPDSTFRVVLNKWRHI